MNSYRPGTRRSATALLVKIVSMRGINIRMLLVISSMIIISAMVRAAERMRPERKLAMHKDRYHLQAYNNLNHIYMRAMRPLGRSPALTFPILRFLMETDRWKGRPIHRTLFRRAIF